jgi:hypothetical protein
MFLRSEVRYDFRINMFRLYLQLFVGVIKSGIICVCLRIVVCFCFVCLRLVHPKLPISLDCPFSIL